MKVRCCVENNVIHLPNLGISAAVCYIQRDVLVLELGLSCALTIAQAGLSPVDVKRCGKIANL